MSLQAHHTNRPGTFHTLFTVESKEMGWEGKNETDWGKKKLLNENGEHTPLFNFTAIHLAIIHSVYYTNQLSDSEGQIQF